MTERPRSRSRSHFPAPPISPHRYDLKDKSATISSDFTLSGIDLSAEYGFSDKAVSVSASKDVSFSSLHSLHVNSMLASALVGHKR